MLIQVLNTSLVTIVSRKQPTDDVDGATAVKLQFLANAHLYHILLASASIGQILDFVYPDNPMFRSVSLF